MELCIFILFAYIAFNLSNSFDIIAIVTLIFCGVSQSKYAMKNLSTAALNSLENCLEMIKYIMENLVFLQIGLILFTSKSLEWNIPFIAISNVYFSLFF